MIKRIYEMLFPFILSIIVTFIVFKIKRNKPDVFYFDFSESNLALSVLLFLFVIIFLGQTKGKYAFLPLFAIILLFFLNLLFTYYKIENNNLLIKKNMFSRYSYINIKEIINIEVSSNLTTDAFSYKIIMSNDVFIHIETKIEDINGFFLKLKDINDEIIFPSGKSLVQLIELILKIIFQIVLSIVIYSISFNKILEKIL
jgi:hypothetical protein